MTDDESIAKVVYEDLVQLTFLCGRGLTLPVLMNRFLRTMAPRIPATHLWLVTPQRVLAATMDVPPPSASCDWQGLVPVALGPDWLVSVLPDVALISRGMPATELCRDVLALFARMLALAWQAEAVSLPALALDDYRQAKDAFQREWLSALLDRHGGNRSSAAVSSGLSRARLHQLIRTFSLENRHAPSADDAVRDR